MATVKQIKDRLLELGFDNTTLNGKKKTELEQLLSTTENGLETVSFDDISEDIVQDGAVPQNTAPLPSDPEWTQYVMDKLTKKEKYKDKYPKVDGLRRLAYKMYGHLLSSQSRVEHVSNNVVIIRHTLIIHNPEDPYLEIKIDGLADATENNTISPYNKFLTATADTRAEGRALKRLLKLQVTTAEELEQESGFDFIVDSDEFINSNQINFINIMCGKSERGLDINIKKLVEHMYGKLYKNGQLKHEHAAAITAQLSEFQREPQNIPEDIKGYITNWNSTFNAE